MLEFPYDTQRCYLDFGNVLEPIETVNIAMTDEPVDLRSFYPSNEFDVYAADVKVYKKKVSGIFFYVKRSLTLRKYVGRMNSEIWIQIYVRFSVCVGLYMQ